MPTEAFTGPDTAMQLVALDHLSEIAHLFMRQQYRWCCGATSLIWTEHMWRVPLPVNWSADSDCAIAYR